MRIVKEREVLKIELQVWGRSSTCPTGYHLGRLRKTRLRGASFRGFDADLTHYQFFLRKDDLNYTYSDRRLESQQLNISVDFSELEFWVKLLVAGVAWVAESYTP